MAWRKRRNRNVCVSKWRQKKAVFARISEIIGGYLFHLLCASVACDVAYRSNAISLAISAAKMIFVVAALSYYLCSYYSRVIITIVVLFADRPTAA